MIDLVLPFTAVGLIIYSFYKYVTRNNDYFKKRGIPFIKPKFLIGSSAEFFFKKITLSELMQRLYNSYPSERLIGYFDFTTPTLVVRDPELFKQIAVKHFDAFEDHKFLIDPEVDSLLGNTVFLMRGKKWRDMRATLSPAFTGSKMRLMFELVRDCAMNTSGYFCEVTGNSKVQSVEMLDILTRYATDVIATCSFGIQVNSIKDRNSTFHENGRKITEKTSLSKNIKFFVQRFAPQIMKLLKIEYYNADFRNFFTNLILDNMDTRRKQGIYRPDMIDILMKAKDGTLTYQEDRQPAAEGFATVTESSIGQTQITHKWSDLELISQCFVFFAAGYDSVTALLVAVTYELAMHPDIQQRLIDEIDETESNLGAGVALSYDGIQKMKYMDMVVSEIMRYGRISSFTDRVCTKDYEVDVGGRIIKIDKGTQLFIPVYGYHHDPKYFPNPDEFDPERFSDENKGNINMSAYVPFGAGPRNCIGSRFALMESKALLYYLLKDFTLEVNEKTQMKIKSTPSGIYPENGLHLNIRLRK